MAKIDVKCPVCGGTKVIKHGISESGKQRHYCEDIACKVKSFQLEYCYAGCEPGINDKMVTIAANTNVIRDTSRVLGISQDKVMYTLKKRKNR